MEKKITPIGEALAYGWEKTKENLKFFIGMMVVAFLTIAVFLLLYSWLMEVNEVAGFIAYVVYYVVCIVISIGVMKIGLMLYDGKKPEISDLFTHYQYFWKYFLVSLFYGAIVMLGLILLIVPGIIWAIKYQFMFYLVVDKDMKPMEAMKKSAEMSQGIKGQIFLFCLVIGLVYYLGFLALFVGVLVTAPLAMMAYTFMYRKLYESQEKTGSSAPEVKAPTA